MDKLSDVQLPLPAVDHDSRPYWEACRRHELRVQRCVTCGTLRFPPRAMCFQCNSFSAEWVLCSGRARVYSWVVPRLALHPAVRDKVPYIAALVELDEGPRMMTNLVGCGPEAVYAEMPLELIWDDENPELPLPKFRPVQESTEQSETG